MANATTTSLALARDASPLARFLVAVRSILILKDDAANAYYARMLHLSLDREVYAKLARRMLAHPEWRRIVEERQSFPRHPWDLEKLQNLPAGTLGHAYARYYLDHGIQPFTDEFIPNDEVEYMVKLYRETHDIHHILTGYGIDPVGEVEVQAFYFGNLGLRHSAFIALSSMLSSRGGHAWKLVRFVRRLRAAYRRGKASAMILGLPINELWELPVSEIAARYVAAAESQRTTAPAPRSREIEG